MKAILAPERLLHGSGDLSWMKDMKDTTSYRVISRDHRGVMVQIDEADIMGLLSIKNAFQGTSITFWGLIEDLLMNSNAVSPYATIEELEVFLEVPVSELSQPVPVGMHMSEDENGDQLTWESYFSGGSQPLVTSLDGTRCILRTNIGAQHIVKEEVLVLIALANENPAITLLNKVEVKSLMASITYTTQE